MRRYIWWIVLAGALLIIPGCFLCRACRAPSDTNPAQSSSNQPASSQPASNQPPRGQTTISKAAIRWQSPNMISFTWSVSNLDPDLEYWVYTDVGFTENTSPFGSNPEDVVMYLEMPPSYYEGKFFPAADGKGSHKWGSNTQPHNPAGELVLMCYDPVTKKARIVGSSGPINTSKW